MTGAPTPAPAPLTPAPAEHPGRAGYPAMVRAQTRLEVVLTLRRGESLLLTLVIPVVLLAFFTAVPVLPSGGIGGLTPGMLALAVMSTAFTGQAIATAYERRYGVLKRLGATPLPRWALLAGKTAAVAVVEVLQLAVLAVLALLLGWHPSGAGVPAAVLLLIVATGTFSALGLLLAGTLPAEAVLAGANALWLVLTLIGGVLVPTDRLPSVLAAVGRATPTGALSHGLRAALVRGHTDVVDLLVLLAWGLVLGVAAARTFRWE